MASQATYGYSHARHLIEMLFAVSRMRLKDKVAIVTGASRGIGRSIAKLFAQEGAKVVINHIRSEQEASDLAEEIRKQGGQAIHVKADVSKPEDVRRLIKS